MFLTTYPLKLDEKGRFFLPSKYREKLGPGLVIVQGQENCLYVFTVKDFEAMANRVLSESDTFEDVRAYRRMLGADASESVPDKQSRVTVPQPLRDYAQLDRDIIVTGAIDHVEIWNPELWEQYRAAQQPKYSQINKQLGQPTGGAQ